MENAQKRLESITRHISPKHPLIIVLLGAPGAGKGTYARLLSHHYQIPAISTGDLVRQEIRVCSSPDPLEPGILHHLVLAMAAHQMDICEYDCLSPPYLVLDPCSFFCLWLFLSITVTIPTYPYYTTVHSSYQPHSIEQLPIRPSD